MKILVITGSRAIWDSNVVFRILKKYESEGFTHLMNGTAAGVDRLARSWAVECNIIPMDRPADWNEYGLSAGPKRNIDMIDEAHVKSSGNCELCVIWDGTSRGTKQAHDYWKSNYPQSHVQIHIENVLPDWGKRNI